MKNKTWGRYFLALIFGFHTKHLPYHTVFKSRSSPVELILLSSRNPNSENKLHLQLYLQNNRLLNLLHPKLPFSTFHTMLNSFLWYVPFSHISSISFLLILYISSHISKKSSRPRAFSISISFPSSYIFNSGSFLCSFPDN